MAAIGGPLESVTLAGRSFAVAADADTQRKLGGFENDVQPNGDGTARMIKSRIAWRLSGLMVEIDDSRGDQEFLQELQNRNDFFPITATYASGETYQGTGQILGEVQTGNQNATASMDVGGPGNFTRQA